MTVNYTFDHSQGGNNGYVHVIRDGELLRRLSFVGNSGVKFGGMEAAILDVKAMVQQAGGLAAFDPAQGAGIDENGMVAIDPYDTEELSRLMTGVRYAGDYAWMQDNPNFPVPPPADASAFYQILENNHDRDNLVMKIDVTPVDVDNSIFSIDIDLDSDPTYEQVLTLPQPPLGHPTLQAHWGSGVVFSNVVITPKAYFEEWPLIPPQPPE